MLIKAGVDISRLNREIRKALNKIDNIYRNNGEDLIITSTYEGTHSPGSKHYANDAIDIRKSIISQKATLILLDDVLGPDFFILEENTCIHIHFIRK